MSREPIKLLPEIQYPVFWCLINPIYTKFNPVHVYLLYIVFSGETKKAILQLFERKEMTFDFNHY